MIKGMVYLVGAGPGDSGLITVKGLECIKKADVIVYDRLAGKELLSFAKTGAELIYAGKSPAGHTLKQEEINGLIAQKALAGKTVTRLKGGDPFVFGRGGEEAQALARAGVPFEVVPGVTSAVAAPAYAGIPVTHRKSASALSIITGNEDPDKGTSSIDWPKIATGAETLVFLMGMSNLPGIVSKLVENGRPCTTPAAVVMWGTTARQKTVTGTLADIVQKTQEAGLENPAVVVVGEVVSLRDDLNWFEKKPLFGLKVLVTRPSEQAGALSEKLKELGCEVLALPAIEISAPENFDRLDRAIEELPSFEWVVFTSANGVEYFFKRLFELGYDARRLFSAHVCSIGPKTAQALKNYGIAADYMPGEYRSEEIAGLLLKLIGAGDRVLLPRADIAPPELALALKKAGAEVVEVTAYRTLKPGRTGHPYDRDAIQRLKAGKIDVVTFTSSSAVRNFVEIAGIDPSTLNGLAHVACIGPVTAGTAGQLGIVPDIVASEHTAEGLANAIAEYFQKV